MAFIHTNKAILLGEAVIIVFVLNSSSFLSTTTYERSIDIAGILLTIGLVVWITLSARQWSGRSKQELALQSRSISRWHWKILIAVVLALFLVAAMSEWLSPTQFEGPITPSRMVVVAAFTLTFGPLFEEFLFRGYLFARVKDVTRGRTLALGRLDLSLASLFSGPPTGHHPPPVCQLHLRDRNGVEVVLMTTYHAWMNPL